MQLGKEQRTAATAPRQIRKSLCKCAKVNSNVSGKFIPGAAEWNATATAPVHRQLPLVKRNTLDFHFTPQLVYSTSVLSEKRVAWETTATVGYKFHSLMEHQSR